MEVTSLRFWCWSMVAVVGLLIGVMQFFPVAASLDGGEERKQLAVERLRLAEQRLARDSTDLQAHVAKAYALWDLGDNSAALEAYFAGLYVNPDVIDVQFGQEIERWSPQDVMKVGEQKLPVSKALRIADDVFGKRILVYYKKGHGDTLQFTRFLMAFVEEKEPAEVLFIPQKALETLLRHSLAHLDDRLQVLSVDTDVSALEYDKHIHLLGLPHYLGVKAEDIPCKGRYLQPSEDAVKAMAEVCEQAFAGDEGLKLGLVWQGDPNHIHDSDRSMPLQALAPLESLEGVSCYALQVGPGCSQLDSLDSGWKQTPPDLGSFCHSFNDTAALMEQMDLVVTIDTASAHLASGLGCQTIVMLPKNPDLRWIGEATEGFWSDHAYLLRQKHLGDWDEPVRSLKKLLVDDQGA